MTVSLDWKVLTHLFHMFCKHALNLKKISQVLFASRLSYFCTTGSTHIAVSTDILQWRSTTPIYPGTSVSWPEEGYRGCNMCARTGQRQMNSGGKEERIEMVVITLTFIHIRQKWIPSPVTTHTLSHSCASRYTNPHFTATTQKHTFKEGWDVATQTYSHTHRK